MKTHLVPGSLDAISLSDMESGEAESRIEFPQERAEANDLKRIEAALRRLDDGKFGLCLYCGDPISMKRLEVNPAINSCGTCDED